MNTKSADILLVAGIFLQMIGLCLWTLLNFAEHYGPALEKAARQIAIFKY